MRSDSEYEQKRHSARVSGKFECSSDFAMPSWTQSAAGADENEIYKHSSKACPVSA